MQKGKACCRRISDNHKQRCCGGTGKKKCIPVTSDLQQFFIEPILSQEVQEAAPWHLQSFVWESGLFQPADTSQQSRTVTCQLARKKEQRKKEKEAKKT